MQQELFSYVDAQPPAGTEGPLVGKSVVIQPNMSVRSWPTEAGSAALERYVALEDATVVERLRAAGGTIAGATRMAELGFGLMGDTAADVVSGGQCDVALVTDTLGEARYAASLAGAWGLKPSWGTVSRFGLIGLVPSMECYGIVARTSADVTTVMTALVGGDDRDPSMIQDCSAQVTSKEEGEKGGPVVGVVSECKTALTPSESAALANGLSALEAKGARVETLSLPDFDLFPAVHQVVGSAEASSSAGKYDSVRYGHRAADTENWNEMYLKSRAESFGTLIKTYLFQGAYYQFENYPAFENACRIRRRLVQNTAALFEKVDVLAFPTRRSDQGVAPVDSIEDVYKALALTCPANVLGLPALTVPGLAIGNGHDFGLQLVGPALSDARLIRLGEHLTQ